MPIGTSVIGSQLLLNHVTADKRTFLLLIQRSSSQPPRRIGYYWIEAYIDGAPHGPVYIPGFRILLPYFGLLTGDLQKLWVDWNEGGLIFETIIADAP
jgi:hypothetical protein